jgi:hypothetical protein
MIIQHVLVSNIWRSDMEINISELRKQRRPLWMSELDEESSADILGGGGDLFSDRIPAEWTRERGEEIAQLTGDDLTRMLMEGKDAEEDYVS